MAKREVSFKQNFKLANLLTSHSIGAGKNRDDPNREQYKTYKNPPPVGITEHDIFILRKVQRRAYRLDNMFGCGPFRVGISSLVGFVPGAGDLLDTLLALMVIRTACRCTLPWLMIFRMLFNILLDFLVGLVPILGDLADATYKANTRNANLLEDYLTKRGYKNSVDNGVIKAGEPLAGVVFPTGSQPQMSMRANGDVDLEAGRGAIAGFGQMKKGYGRMDEKNYGGEQLGVRVGTSDSTTPIDPPPPHLYQQQQRPAFTGQQYAQQRPAFTGQQYAQQNQQMQQQEQIQQQKSFDNRRQYPQQQQPLAPPPRNATRNPLKRLPVKLPELQIPKSSSSSQRGLVGAVVQQGRQMASQPRNITGGRR